jgi:molybdopterin-guanine dinucleotide biosynthesis protein A
VGSGGVGSGGVGSALAILAGGRGERLGGVAKGLLRLGGRTLIEAQLALGAAFDETLIVTDDPGPYQALGARIVPDRQKGRGAPGGVHAALAAAQSDWVLVVACDMPFLTPAVLDRLLAERTGPFDVVAFEGPGEEHCALQPLPSLWRRAVAEEVGLRLAEGPSLRRLCEAFRLYRLPDAALARVDPSRKALLSVNRPEELLRHGLSRPG